MSRCFREYEERVVEGDWLDALDAAVDLVACVKRVILTGDPGGGGGTPGGGTPGGGGPGGGGPGGGGGGGSVGAIGGGDGGHAPGGEPRKDQPNQPDEEIRMAFYIDQTIGHRVRERHHRRHRAARKTLLTTGAAVLLGAVGGTILGRGYGKA
jgi:hypothetical protein